MIPEDDSNNNQDDNDDNNNKGDDNDNEKNDGDDIICSSLFLHVPHFTIVPEEEQLAYVAELLRALAA